MCLMMMMMIMLVYNYFPLTILTTIWRIILLWAHWKGIFYLNSTQIQAWMVVWRMVIREQTEIYLSLV